MKVTLLGPVPPPHGGVSVHLVRLQEKLSIRGIKVRHEDEQSSGESFFSFVRRAIFGKKTDILHSHVHNPWTLWALGIRATLGWPTVVTVHNSRVLNWLAAAPAWKRRIIRQALHRVDQYIAVSPEVQSQLQSLGAPEDRIRVIPAFIAPSRASWEDAQLPLAEQQFMARFQTVISMNAFHLEEVDETPLYGADLIGPFLKHLVESHDAGLVLYVAKEPVGNLLKSLEQEWEALGVRGRVHVVTGSVPFGPAMVRSHVYIRPTSTDGDSVSVREALAVGVPVVASDVCDRPTGCHVFKSRDPVALARLVSQVVLEKKEGLQSEPETDTVDAIIEAYVEAGGGGWAN